MVRIIAFKFIALINFSGLRAPEDHNKFVIWQVPCYTEGKASLQRTIDSLVVLKYDDKRRHILTVCDRNIIGLGNDRPMPHIVLDIQRAGSNLDPVPLNFVSIGEGARQHNIGKVYSGLYERVGYAISSLVVIKAGQPTEWSRPGNRGKRDSQMVIMHFLNKVCSFFFAMLLAHRSNIAKVHYAAPMNPLDSTHFPRRKRGTYSA